jgi:hypothetical protein
LTQIVSQNVSTKIKIISKVDPVILARIGKSDLIAAEINMTAHVFLKRKVL